MPVLRVRKRKTIDIFTISSKKDIGFGHELDGAKSYITLYLFVRMAAASSMTNGRQ